MITVAIRVTDECEELITNMPRGYEYELTQDDGDGTVVITVHDVDEITSGMEVALDVNLEVISYTVA